MLILGYFALSLKVLILPDDLSIRKRKEYDGFSGKIHGNPIREIPCYLIGQLAKNSSVNNNINGSDLIDLALSVIQPSVNAVGGRWALIECHNNEKLLDFYEDNDFHAVLNELDMDIDMIQMVRKIC